MNLLKNFSTLFVIVFYTSLHADITDTCSNLINLANSPSHAESPCPTPFKRIILESTYTIYQLPGHAGIQQNFPNAQIRIGLPANNEFMVLPPNYSYQNSAPGSGFSNSGFSLKHAIPYSTKWLFALEAITTTPGGSAAYGSLNWGGIFNGMASYTIDNYIAITGILGFSRISNTALEGGYYFDSINPDLVISYSTSQKLSFYGELYGQSHINVEQGAGLNFDAGALFLVSSNVLLSFSLGQQLVNYLGFFDHYINFSLVTLL